MKQADSFWGAYVPCLVSPQNVHWILTACDMHSGVAMAWVGWGEETGGGRSTHRWMKLYPTVSQGQPPQRLALTGLPQYLHLSCPRHLVPSMITDYSYPGQDAVDCDMHMDPLWIFLKYDSDPGSFRRGLRHSSWQGLSWCHCGWYTKPHLSGRALTGVLVMDSPDHTLNSFFFKFLKKVFIFNWRTLLHSIVLASAIYQYESVIDICMFRPSWTSLPPLTPSHPSMLSQRSVTIRLWIMSA